METTDLTFLLAGMTLSAALVFALRELINVRRDLQRNKA